MRDLFNEYSILLLCFVCSVIGFNLLDKFIFTGNGIHDIICHLLYGIA